MKNTKKLVSLLSVGMILLSTCTACSKQEVVTDEPEASEVEIIDPMFVYLENCTLDENAEKDVLNSYASYINSAINEKDMTFTCRIEDDGSVHYDAVAKSGRTVDTISDVKTFDSVKDAFAYLYNNGQVDIDGNILVRAVDDVKNEMVSVGEKAESDAQTQIDADLDANSNAESSEEGVDSGNGK